MMHQLWSGYYYSGLSTAEKRAKQLRDREKSKQAALAPAVEAPKKDFTRMSPAARAAIEAEKARNERKAGQKLERQRLAEEEAKYGGDPNWKIRRLVDAAMEKSTYSEKAGKLQSRLMLR